MPKNPCFDHGCALCCYETEMLLTSADVARLEGKGFKREEFTEKDEDGFLRLRNVDPVAPEEKKHCTFLKEKRCSVYADRPEGCRWYPVTLTETGVLTRDTDCPHRLEFAIPPASQRKLLRLLVVLNKEARARR